MTTIAESICLMDWLREHREIGLECMTDDDIYDHHPEYCDRETRDYEEWEQGLRSSSPVAVRTNALCRRASQKAWQEKHEDHWNIGETMTRRVNALTQLTELRERIRH